MYAVLMKLTLPECDTYSTRSISFSRKIVDQSIDRWSDRFHAHHCVQEPIFNKHQNMFFGYA